MFQLLRITTGFKPNILIYSFYIIRTVPKLLICTIGLTFVFHGSQSKAETELDPPEILLGERLFLETRFAQYFKAYLDQGGEVNRAITKGDPVLNKTVRFFGLPPYQIPFADGPFAGQTYNCRTCHLVDEHVEQRELGMRSYSDFASRSPLPTRDDGQVTTVRNAPALVDASLLRENFILHLDGEFYSLPQLVRGTLTNRNFGWLPGEKSVAIEHICKVVHEDDGTNELAVEFGGLSYTETFAGITNDSKQVANEYLLPKSLRIEIQKTSCYKVFEAVANLIAIYTEDLVFAEDDEASSPYDLFLKVNNLPKKPESNETNMAYSKRLMRLINDLKKQGKLQFINKNPNTKDGGFRFHDQPYQFGAQQLAGMELFFNQDEKNVISTGNCIACHPAPHFTDFSLHNTGITQVEYDAIHGNGAFNQLDIPNLAKRNKQLDHYLPATHQHPNRKGIFRAIPSKTKPLATDLGTWNIFYNDDYLKSQQRIKNLICNTGKTTCQSEDHALERSIATFKTPGLRYLGHSAPYMHNGQISDLHATLSFYIGAAANTRQGLIRNGDQEIGKIHIKPKDIHPLVLFLVSLYEDYN